MNQFIRKDQLAADVILSLVQKVSQSNTRFNALDKLIMTVHSVMMAVGFGKLSIKSSGRPLSLIAHLKTSIVEGKISENCLAHAIIIAIENVENGPDYEAYRKGRKIRPVVQKLLTVFLFSCLEAEEFLN